MGRWRRVAWRHPEWWALALSAAAWSMLALPRVHHVPSWALMVPAMMLPLVVTPIRTTAARSLWARRHRAIAGFLAGYLVVWLGALAVAHALTALLGLHGEAPVSVLAAAFGLATLWHFGSISRRASNACHRTMPLAPSGLRADRDCARYGATVGARCLTSCWAMMLACDLAGHRPLLLVVVALLLTDQRYLRRPSRQLRLGAGARVRLLPKLQAPVGAES